MNFLAKKTVILTGASSGIGQALALALAQAGVNLVLNARRGEELAATAEACAAHEVAAEPVAGSCSAYAVAQELVARARTLGSLAGFVHAAGVLEPGPTLWELTPERFRTVFDASVAGAHQLVHAVVPLLLAQGGGFAVFFGSGAADAPVPGIGAYCAAKAAEEALARQLAAEEPEIASFVYRPHIVDTRMQREARESTGGAADTLHRTFRPWLEQEKLISPAQSADGLLRLLLPGPEAWKGLSGTTIRWGDPGTVPAD